MSVPKLVRVASIATEENQKDMLEKVQTLSKAAIDVFVKDYKNEHVLLSEKEDLTKINKNICTNENIHLRKNSTQKGLFELNKGCESLYVQNEIVCEEGVEIEKEIKSEVGKASKSKTNKEPQIIQFGANSLKLDEDIQAQLLELQQKGIDINQLLRKFLKQREEKIEKDLEIISREVKSEEQEKTMVGIPIGRYKKAKIRVVISEKYGEKCSEFGCNKFADQVHHEKQFSKYHTHDPKYLKPLCRGHHELRHLQDRR